MTFKSTMATLLLVCVAFSCKNEKKQETVTLSEYKFTDKGQPFHCEGTDDKLINEAIFSFEDDIFTFFKDRSPNPSLARAYAQFMANANNGSLDFADIATPHTVAVFKALKSHSELWEPNNPTSHFNYNSALFNCIANNIRDKRLNTTLHSLLEIHSMSPKLFTPALSSRYSMALNDKYLAAYIAFDLFYTRLFDANLSLVKERAPETVDFNKLPSN